MPLSNSENSAWNALHNGCRVPINDTGIPGAPAALNSSNPAWEQGSINKAVYSTWVLTESFKPEDVQDAEAGKLDLLRCVRHVKKDMLYGFNTDARGKTPGDAMSFRGYPTPVVASSSLDLEYTKNLDKVGPNGDILESGEYNVLSSVVTLSYLLPYAFQYTIELRNTLNTLVSSYEIQIGSGSLIPTHYREVGSDTWLALTEGKIYLSAADVLGLVGAQTYTVSYSSVLQAPYYNLLTDDVKVVDDDGYVRPPNKSIGYAYFTTGIINISCFVNNCNEISSNALFSGNNGMKVELFIPSGSSLSVGVDVFTDEQGTNRALPGRYAWATFNYDLDMNAIYTITKYIEVNLQGLISISYSNITGNNYCWINSNCI